MQNFPGFLLIPSETHRNNDEMIIESEDLFLFEGQKEPYPSFFFEEKPANAIIQNPLIPAIEIQAVENIRTFIDQSLSTASSIVSSEKTANSEEAKSNSFIRKPRKKKGLKKGHNLRKNLRKRCQEIEENCGCKCKRSKCKKNFCECIDRGVSCFKNCGCSGCGNRNQKSLLENNEGEGKEEGNVVFKKVKIE